MNFDQIALTFLNLIENSNDKKTTIKNIAFLLNSYDKETRQTICNKLITYLKDLHRQKQCLFEHSEIRASANDDYLEYIKLLTDLVKGE